MPQNDNGSYLWPVDLQIISFFSLLVSVFHLFSTINMHYLGIEEKYKSLKLLQFRMNNNSSKQTTNKFTKQYHTLKEIETYTRQSLLVRHCQDS